MHLFNHRSVLKLRRYPACFGPAVEIGGCSSTCRLSAGWIWLRTRPSSHPEVKFRNHNRLTPPVHHSPAPVLPTSSYIESFSICDMPKLQKNPPILWRGSYSDETRIKSCYVWWFSCTYSTSFHLFNFNKITCDVVSECDVLERVLFIVLMSVWIKLCVFFIVSETTFLRYPWNTRLATPPLHFN